MEDLDGSGESIGEESAVVAVLVGASWHAGIRETLDRCVARRAMDEPETLLGAESVLLGDLRGHLREASECLSWGCAKETDGKGGRRTTKPPRSSE